MRDFTLRHFLRDLAGWQASVVVSLLAVSVVAALIHWAIVAHVSRLRPGNSIWKRMPPFGLNGWHIGVLRRSWYPNQALPLRRWVVLTYVINVGSIFAVVLLMAVWTF